MSAAVAHVELFHRYECLSFLPSQVRSPANRKQNPEEFLLIYLPSTSLHARAGKSRVKFVVERQAISILC